MAAEAEACPQTETSLSVDEAYVVLEPYFLAAKEIFQKQEKGVRVVRLEVARWVHDSPRHFAATTDDGKTVIVAPEMAELPEETVLAIMSHEFGHALDFLYPARWVWFETPCGPQVSSTSDVHLDMDDKRIQQARVAKMKQWQNRDRDTIEMTADGIAEQITGRKIGYLGPCLLQSFERGVKRPRGLR